MIILISIEEKKKKDSNDLGSRAMSRQAREANHWKPVGKILGKEINLQVTK